jgi:hypothetical protein
MTTCHDTLANTGYDALELRGNYTWKSACVLKRLKDIASSFDVITFSQTKRLLEYSRKKDLLIDRFKEFDTFAVTVDWTVPLCGWNVILFIPINNNVLTDT